MGVEIMYEIVYIRETASDDVVWATINEGGKVSYHAAIADPEDHSMYY
jgi:hypothetical protein